MKRLRLWKTLGALTALAAATGAYAATRGCHRDRASADADAKAVNVAVVPTSAWLEIGQSRRFGATVRNTSNTGVTWQVNGIAGGNSTVGTISSEGEYAAPAAVPNPATVTVTAISAQDSSASASAVMTIMPPQVAVAVSPASVLVEPGATQQFSAAVTNTGNTGVTWQVNGAVGGSATYGTISAAGLYTAPDTAPSPAIVIVMAVSQANPAAAATAVVSLGAVTALYVSTAGNDNNDGSSSAPWRTIQHAADTAVAGNTVYVMGGTYNEAVAFRNSGSATAGYITFESYPGQTAVVDGTGLKIPGGQFGLFTIRNRSYLALSGFELQNYISNTDNGVPVGIYITDADSYIQILGNKIHDIVTTAKGCRANALGMAVYGSQAPASINNLTVSGNELYHLTTGCSESMSLDGNVDTFAVTNNLVHDNNNIGIDAIGFEKVSPNPAYDQARNGEIGGNIIYHITSYDNPAYGRQYAADGLYSDGGTQNIFERNLVHDVDIALELASEHSGKVTSYTIARSNLIYDAFSVGVTIGGYGPQRGGTDHCQIVNNTLYSNDTKNTGSGEFQIQWYATNNVFENNIVYATAQGLFLHSFTTSESVPATLDYNVYFSPAGASKGIWEWNKTRHTGFAAYQAATGQDAHSTFANPMFLSTAVPDLQVQASSPAVDAGTNPGAGVVGTLDFAGNPRVQGPSIDIGAYEQP